MNAPLRAARATSAPAPTPATAAQRRAALLLHALGGADRAWLVAQLPEPLRPQLALLLRELETLGIPADRTVLDQVLQRPAEPGGATAATSGAPTPAQRLQRLRGAELDRLAALLRREPVRLVVRFLGAEDWPWREALLRRFPAELRGRIARETGAGSALAAPVLRERLLELLARQLDAEAQAARPRGAAWWPFGGSR